MTTFSDENSPATSLPRVIVAGDFFSANILASIRHTHARKDTKKSVPNLSLDADFVIFFTRWLCF